MPEAISIRNAVGDAGGGMNLRLDELSTPTSKLVRLYLLHHGPVRSLKQLEDELNVSHKAIWQAKKILISAGMWRENEREIRTT